jgi:hypothetical protein
MRHKEVKMYSFTKLVKFHPYLGKQYGTDNEFKMPFLLLGKKHYNVNKDPVTPIFTDVVVAKHISGVHRQGYLALVTQAIQGDSLNPNAEQSFWNSIAFYNYIQDMMNNPTEEPTQQMWSAAESAFDEVVSTLKPACILVIGQGLFHRLPGLRNGEFECGGKTIYTRIYQSVNIGAINSPQGNAYDPMGWHPVINAFLDAARANLGASTG